MDDCAAILALAARVTGAARFAYRGTSVDPFAPPERLTVVEAFTRYAGIDLNALLPPEEPARFAAAARAAGIRVADDDTWGDIFSRVLVGAGRTPARIGTRDHSLRISGPAVAAGAANGRGPSTG